MITNHLPNAHKHSGNCLVLLSGGIDSAACVDFYQQQSFSVSALHINYGQPSATLEENAARSLAENFRVPLKVIKTTGTRLKKDGELIGRNAFFLFSALMELDTFTALVALGIHSGTPYYDCSANFLSAAQTIVDGQCNGRIQLVAPFLDWTKKDIWEYCLQYRVPLDLTYSCEKGLEQPCGNCISCKDLEALRVC